MIWAFLLLATKDKDRTLDPTRAFNSTLERHRTHFQLLKQPPFCRTASSPFQKLLASSFEVQFYSPVEIEAKGCRVLRGLSNVIADISPEIHRCACLHTSGFC